MQSLHTTFLQQLEAVPVSFMRHPYRRINWENRLILLSGERGVGKTTMLLQHIRRTFADTSTVFYASVDKPWFATHTIIELAEYLVAHGVTHLFLDDIHLYRGWDTQIKHIYDTFAKLHIILAGAAMIDLSESSTDLVRRCRVYTLRGMSFREYLELQQLATVPPLTLDELLRDHQSIAARLTGRMPVLKHFEHYLGCGYYPFFSHTDTPLADRLEQLMSAVIRVDVPAVANISYDSVYKMKMMMGLLTAHTPATPNLSVLAHTLDVSRDNVYKMMYLLQRAGLIRRLFRTHEQDKLLSKPASILLSNTALLQVLAPHPDPFTLRATFMANMLSAHVLATPDDGCLQVDERYLFHLAANTREQSASSRPNTFIVTDDTDRGLGNRIPLWLFGLLD